MEFNIQAEEGLKTVAEKIVELVADELEDKAVILAMEGEMGAGKTTLTKQIAVELGMVKNRVTSPTFNLHVPYELSGTILDHIDLWRVESWEEVEKLGLAAMLKKKHLLIIEWADMFRYEISALKSQAGVYWTTLTNFEEEARRIEIIKL